jgi:hypothetical protein
MPGLTNNPLEYYARPGLMTDLSSQIEALEGLPSDLSGLCRFVQNALLHIFWAERYGVELSEARKQEVEIRSTAAMLMHLRDLDDSPVSSPHSADRRVVGNCRDFSTLLCALLRHQATPARARCGFGAYFEPSKYVDHWVCEYWKADENRWIKVDAQLDVLQQEVLRLNFDPLDVPPDQFLTGGKAWQLCRDGQADPNRFGIFDMWGLWFIRGDLLRDLASLNRMELLPWDSWGLIEKDDAELTPEDMALLDHVAGVTLKGNEAFAEVRTLYEDDARLRVPDVIKSYTSAGVRSVNVVDESETQ